MENENTKSVNGEDKSAITSDDINKSDIKTDLSNQTDISKGCAQVPKQHVIQKNPEIKDAFLKNVTKEQLYKFYPDVDKDYLDGLHNDAGGQKSTGAGVTGRGSVTSGYAFTGDMPEGKKLRKVTQGYLDKNPDVVQLGVKAGDMYPM